METARGIFAFLKFFIFQISVVDFYVPKFVNKNDAILKFVLNYENLKVGLTSTWLS